MRDNPPGAVADSRWQAPAKLNLFLHVTDQRPDGYHTLETIFQFLDFGDEIMLRVRKDGEIRRVTDLVGVPAEEDLVVRAARVLQSRTATPLGVDITLMKRIPMGGLGGGNSDAATTLVGLNHIWALGLDVRTLAEIGLGLGADVPVFVWGEAAFASGVSDIGRALVCGDLSGLFCGHKGNIPCAGFDTRHTTHNNMRSV